jgi:hypothetical protein
MPQHHSYFGHPLECSPICTKINLEPSYHLSAFTVAESELVRALRLIRE